MTTPQSDRPLPWLDDGLPELDEWREGLDGRPSRAHAIRDLIAFRRTVEPELIALLRAMECLPEESELVSHVARLREATGLAHARRDHPAAHCDG